MDNQSYHWRINTRNHYLILLCRKGRNGKSIIEVTINSDIHRYWIHFPNIQNVNVQPVTNSMVVNIISEALKLKWNPDENKLIKYFYNIEESRLCINK